MKKFAISILILVLLGGAVLYYMRPRKDPNRPIAKIAGTQGDARLLQSGERVIAREGEELRAGTVIFAGNDSGVNLLLENGTFDLDLGSLATFYDRKIVLPYGRGRLRFSGKMELNLAGDTVYVRGKGTVVIQARRGRAEIRPRDGDVIVSYRGEKYPVAKDTLVISKRSVSFERSGDPSTLQIVYPQEGETIYYGETNARIVMEWRGVRAKEIQLRVTRVGSKKPVEEYRGLARDRYVWAIPGPGEFVMTVSESAESEARGRAAQVKFKIVAQ